MDFDPTRTILSGVSAKIIVAMAYLKLKIICEEIKYQWGCCSHVFVSCGLNSGQSANDLFLENWQNKPTGNAFSVSLHLDLVNRIHNTTVFQNGNNM